MACMIELHNHLLCFLHCKVGIVNITLACLYEQSLLLLIGNIISTFSICLCHYRCSASSTKCVLHKLSVYIFTDCQYHDGCQLELATDTLFSKAF